MLRMLSNLEYVFDKSDFDKIFFVYNVYQKAFEPFEDQVSFYCGWQNLTLEDFKKCKSSLLFVDDCLGNHSDRNFMLNLYKVHSHHLNISIISACHSIFSKEIHNMREISQNCLYLFILSSRRMVDQIEMLSRQIFKGGTKKGFMEIYKSLCESKPHQYVMIDTHPLTMGGTMIKRNLMPSEWPIECYVLNGTKLGM